MIKMALFRKSVIIFIGFVFIVSACGKTSENPSSSGSSATTGSTAASGSSAAKNRTEKIVLKAGLVTADNEPLTVYANKLAESVKQRTDGQIEIEVYANSTLGHTLDVIQQVAAGAPVLSYADGASLAEFVADLGILQGPYLINRPEDFTKIVASDWFEEVNNQMKDKGVRILSFNWYYGARHMISWKEIRNPDDLKGLNVRIPAVPMWKETVTAMGGNPVELPWSEVYTALQTKVVDAAEAPLATLYGSKLHEVAKVISTTGHFKSVGAFVMSEQVFNSIPEDLQAILLEEFEKFGAEESAAAIQADLEWKKKLEDEGAQFVEDVDVKAFQEATKAVYTKFPEWTPGLHDRVSSYVQP